MLIDMIEALLIGMLAAVTVLFTFQTRVPYPDWLLQTFEHPWVFFCMFISAALFAGSSPRIAVMIMLLMLAMWFDWVLFTRPNGSHMRKKERTVNPEVSPGKTLVAEVYPYDPPSSTRRPDASVPGPALQAIPVIDLQYPTFQHLDEFVYGPATFE